ncbi:carbohydrate kinase family protein [Boudabousia marimammalium]|uniref:Carbohydrate kinase PfkB domain-containing protein n=1 Tax=Boudabousia marimammalium TaxID=156892 RepID=A0A1Q5PRQ2_9ACTO|nr:carbohydrate kinase [Boudabousia marimammalium]OKL50251.1 hypothetical protein BM477_02340 [Boudabousia marimammalium]
MTVLVLGEALIDRFHNATGVQDVPGGSAANVALGVARLGVESTLGTWVAEDSAGRQLTDHLADSAVRLAPGSTDAPVTSIADIQLSPKGDAQYEFTIQWAPPVFALDAEVLALHTGSIAAVMEPGAESVRTLVEAAKSQAVITFDPNARPAIMDQIPDSQRLLREASYQADLIKVSDEDCAWLTGLERSHFQPSQEHPELVDDWFAHGVSLVVITAGKAGLVAYLPDGTKILQESKPRRVVDTVGAGDSVMAALLVQLVEQRISPDFSVSKRRLVFSPHQVKEMLHYASTVAALTCERAGADLPTREQVQERL